MKHRLIDLHADWLLQYAPETTVFDSGLYPEIAGRLGQLEGYLQSTRAAVLSCSRRPEDWARQGDAWASLGGLIARLEAEFPGRLLIGPEDHARWLADAEGLAWGVVGVGGFDALVRGPGDLDRLPALFARGVRLFRPVDGPTSVLGGSSASGDDRGLTALGIAFLEALAAMVPEARAEGPRPLLDLAQLSPSATADVLTWLEADSDRPRRLIPVQSHGCLLRADVRHPLAISREDLTRLRSLGGVVGLCPACYDSPEALRADIEEAASIPFLGRAGHEGIAIGTNLLGVDRTPPGLGHVAEVVAWFRKSFAPSVADALIRGNAQDLLARAVGAARPE